MELYKYTAVTLEETVAFYQVYELEVKAISMLLVVDQLYISNPSFWNPNTRKARAALLIKNTYFIYNCMEYKVDVSV
jgi:hypothetical protein